MDLSAAINDMLNKTTPIDPDSCEPGNHIYPLCATIYGYAPSLAWNALFLSIFALSTLVHFCQGMYYRMWTFIVAICLGGICEVIGQTGRLILHNDPLSDPGFKLQLIFLTLAPAFLAAAIYLNLKHLVLTFGSSFSRLKPASYTWFFISCDLFSIALQGAGGAVAAMADPKDTGSGGKEMFDTGNELMNAGIVVQGC
ncbi:sphingoid long-chain base transporter RSB1 [Venturia nashicola]|nr:sphingoid long-chain base transporter RSB1 [Venturia nashicola]